jgi:beta-glucanase (GH16 family)
MTHSWESNIALFSASTVSAEGGELRLALLPAPAGTTDSGGAAKSFLGAEVRSLDTISYGRVRARVRLARGSAVVSSLVTIYTPWPADNWNELDIECLGKDPSEVQFNAMVYTGPPVTPPVSTSVVPTQEPTLVSLGFDTSHDFHVYEIEWTPAGARFVVDDALLHTWDTHIGLLGLPQNVLMTIWASSAADWAGPVGDDTGQAVAVYDWLELYRFDVP